MYVGPFINMEHLYIYETYARVAEFGEANIAVRAKNKEEADKKIAEFCKDNHQEDRYSFITCCYLAPKE
jgi:hypothetical protein